MQEAIDKAAVLIEALPYIQRYYEKIVVVKLGGSVMDNPQAEQELLRDIVFMHNVGMHPIIVHGGGKEISAAMDEAGLEPNFVQGLRYTDERTLAIAETVADPAETDEEVRHLLLVIRPFEAQHG